jgi:hypothetical protein
MFFESLLRSESSESESPSTLLITPLLYTSWHVLDGFKLGVDPNV